MWIEAAAPLTEEGARVASNHFRPHQLPCLISRPRVECPLLKMGSPCPTRILPVALFRLCSGFVQAMLWLGNLNLALIFGVAD
jgi:hypothetical protein